MKLCKDCIHSDIPNVNTRCFKHVVSIPYISLVDGTRNRRLIGRSEYCFLERETSGRCGPEAKFFEPRPTILNRIKSLFTGGK